MKPRVQVVLIGVAWGVFSALCFLRWHAPAKGWILGILAGVMLVSGAFVPPMALAIHKGLNALTRFVLEVLTWTLLGLTYYLFLTPLGVVLRLAGSVQIRKEMGARRESYWIERPRKPPDVARYLRPF